MSYFNKENKNWPSTHLYSEFYNSENYIKVFFLIFTMKVLVEKTPPLDVHNSCGYSAIQIRIEAGIDAPSNIDSKNIRISFLNKN